MKNERSKVLRQCQKTCFSPSKLFILDSLCIFDSYLCCYSISSPLFLFQVTSLACLLTVLTAGTAKMGLFSLPHFSRLRIMMFITLFTVIFTIFILFLNISHLHTFMPVDYGKMVSERSLLISDDPLQIQSL